MSDEISALEAEDAPVAEGVRVEVVWLAPRWGS